MANSPEFKGSQVEFYSAYCITCSGVTTHKEHFKIQGDKVVVTTTCLKHNAVVSTRIS